MTIIQILFINHSLNPSYPNPLNPNLLYLNISNDPFKNELPSIDTKILSLYTKQDENRIRSTFFKTILLFNNRKNKDLNNWHCININTPSDSFGVLHDVELYYSAILNSKKNYAYIPSTTIPPSLINLYLEHIPNGPKYYPNLIFPNSQTVWFMANLEVVEKSTFNRNNPEIGVVFVKNKIGLEKLIKFRNDNNYKFNIIYTKHSSRDLYDPIYNINNKRDWNTFLHLAGASPEKNTEIILRAWAKHPEWPNIIIKTGRMEYCKLYDELIQNATNHTLNNIDFQCSIILFETKNKLQNQIGIHLCPSHTEGYGHYINEARSVGAFVITSNAPPMNELIHNDSGLLIGTLSNEKIGNLEMPSANITIQDIEKTVQMVQHMNIKEKIIRGRVARKNYLQDKDFFFNVMERIHKTFCTSYKKLNTKEDIDLSLLRPYIY